MNNDADLLLIDALDQPLQTNNELVLSRIDEIIKQSIQEHNAYIALNACKTLVGVMKLGGLGLAKALYYTKVNWVHYDTQEEFEEVAFDYIGIAKANVYRYVAVWTMFAEHQVPKELELDMQQRNIKDLIPIAAAIKQGYDIKQETWEAMADAPDHLTVSQIIRDDVKNVPPRKGSLQLYLDNQGTIWAYQDKKRTFVGSLEVNDDDPIVQKAIERIKKGSGMLEKQL